MAEDIIKKSGTPGEYKTDSGGGTTIPGPVLGVVKDNVDPAKSGRIQVYVASVSGPDPDDSKSWVPVSYLSPFYGVTSPGTTNYDGPDKTGYGKYVGNPQSYGFWASAPDIGTEVVCVFVDGRIDQGYYIGCVPQSGLLQMTPGLGAATTVIPNSAEATTYGGADRLPTGEVNYSNPNIRNSATITTDPKPVHSYQAAILSNQGLVRDNIRGVISSSGQRETPSRVFGLSTPGSPIYEGGYTPATIRSAAQSADTAKLSVIGRTGGHSFVMDDGTIDGQDQLVRLRTSAGHQIMMNDSGETLFISHANGLSWVELGKEGTIDLFSTNSVNIRTQGDLNLHADRDVNINAKRNINMFAQENMQVETDKNISFRAGINFSGYAVAKYTFKSDGDMSMSSGGAASLASSGVTYVNGSKINLNTGSSGTVPEMVPAMTKINHMDTTYSTEKGWLFPAPTALLSVVSRAPTHQPFIGAGKGVDVKTNSVAQPTGVQTTPAMNAVNSGTPNTPTAAVTPAIAATVPTQGNKSNPIFNSSDVTTLAAQQAVTNKSKLLSTISGSTVPNSTNTSNQNTNRLTVTENFSQSQSGVGVDTIPTVDLTLSQLRYPDIIPITSGMTVQQATNPGSVLMPGSEPLLQARLAQGMPLERALAGLTTGNFGASSPQQLINSNSVQLSAVSASINASTRSLINSGILTGSESAAQAGGVVLAAANYGAGLITNIVKSVGNTIVNTVGAVTNVITGTLGAISGAATKASDIVNSMASGKYAGNLSDALSNGITGLATSLGNAVSGTINGIVSTASGIVNGITGAIGGIGNTVTGIASSLKGTLRTAFDTVEKSFGNMAADKPNILGSSKIDGITPDLSTPSARYASAEAEIAAAEDEVLTAKRNYRNDDSHENYAALQAAESQLSNARQSAASAATSIITEPISRAAKAVGNFFTSNNSTETASATTTANSGANALPGGVGSMVSQVKGQGVGIVEGVKTAVATTATGVATLAGNLVKNTTSLVVNSVNAVVNSASAVVKGVLNTVGAIKTAAGSIISTLQTQLSSLGKAGGQIKSAVQSVQTFNSAPIIAKTGTLLSDPRIPSPSQVSQAPSLDKTNDQINQEIKTQRQSLEKVEEARESVNELKRIIAEYQEQMNPSSAIYSPTASEKDVARAQEQLRTALKRLADAENAYNSTLS